jgi:hypothetical protein
MLPIQKKTRTTTKNLFILRLGLAERKVHLRCTNDHYAVLHLVKEALADRRATETGYAIVTTDFALEFIVVGEFFV